MEHRDFKEHCVTQPAWNPFLRAYHPCCYKMGLDFQHMKNTGTSTLRRLQLKGAKAISKDLTGASATSPEQCHGPENCPSARDLLISIQIKSRSFYKLVTAYTICASSRGRVSTGKRLACMHQNHDHECIVAAKKLGYE